MSSSRVSSEKDNKPVSNFSKSTRLMQNSTHTRTSVELSDLKKRKEVKRSETIRHKALLLGIRHNRSLNFLKFSKYFTLIHMG